MSVEERHERAIELVQSLVTAILNGDFELAERLHTLDVHGPDVDPDEVLAQSVMAYVALLRLLAEETGREVHAMWQEICTAMRTDDT